VETLVGGWKHVLRQQGHGKIGWKNMCFFFFLPRRNGLSGGLNQEEMGSG